MVKRKGKVRVFPSEPPPVPEATLDRFILRQAQQLQSPPLGVGSEPSLPQLNTTLSPDERTPPPIPAEVNAAKARESDVDHAVSASVSHEGEKTARGEQTLADKLTALGGLVGISNALTAGTTAEGEKELQWLKNQPMENIAEAAVLQSTSAGQSDGTALPPLVKPVCITLDSIWEALARLEKISLNTKTELTLALGDCKTRLVTQEVKTFNLEQKFDELQHNVTKMQQGKSSFEQGFNMVTSKMEKFENYTRRLNLRIVNFPVIQQISPLELFKKYLKEVLGIPDEGMPPMNKVYYMPQKKRQQTGNQEQVGNQERLSEDSLNLTDLLEQSVVESSNRNTLLVTFVLEPDKDWILRLYFKNMQKLFMGQRIWIYPDVSSDTQKKRKQFLEMQTRVLALGGNFFLRFPCRCLVLLLGQRYIFYLPFQLKAFLDSKEPKPISNGIVME